MDEKEVPYVPTPTERWMVRMLDATISQILTGHADGVAVCSVAPDGEPTFMYYNKPDDPVLRGPISKLLGLYEMQNREPCQSKMNAPRSNRSYREH